MKKLFLFSLLFIGVLFSQTSSEISIEENSSEEQNIVDPPESIPEESVDIVKVKKVAKSAKIDKFIEETKYGYNTKVGERGIQLSGGQKQRIGIARTLYRNSKILILDEATSALDNDTENLIMNSINEIDPDITIIMVAHRLSSLKNCKRIIKIENGFKVQDGLREDIIKF